MDETPDCQLNMRYYKFFWNTHKWTGIVMAVIVLNLSLTGFLLLWKKDFDWLQPPTQTATAGGIADFITMQRLFECVFAQRHPDFKSLDDIDRVDFRPGRRVHKVRSKHHHAELQIDAVTGAVLSVDWRPSDLIERLHDGSFYAGWFHRWMMPLAAIALLFLMVSGLYLWLAPISKARRRRRETRS